LFVCYTGWLPLAFFSSFLFLIPFTLFIHIIHDYHVTMQRAGGYGERVVFKFSFGGGEMWCGVRCVGW
jgi:hypothetical protein